MKINSFHESISCFLPSVSSSLISFVHLLLRLIVALMVSYEKG